MIEIIRQVKETGDLKKQARNLKKIIKDESGLLLSAINESKKRRKELNSLERKIVKKLISMNGFESIIEVVNKEIDSNWHCFYNLLPFRSFLLYKLRVSWVELSDCHSFVIGTICAVKLTLLHKRRKQ